MVAIELEYNTARKHLVIPEYGRAIHKMVDYCAELADRDERNKCAKSIINIMGNLFPQLRDVEDYRHKLWDHLFIMSDFTIDIDSPYPLPSRETFQEKPKAVSYPKGNIRYGHYGRVTQQLIDKACELENLEHREKMAVQIFSLMKRSYRQWNRDTVEDELILKHLNELSKGVLKLEANQVQGINDTTPLGNGGVAPRKKKWTNNKTKNNNFKKKF